MLLQGGEWTKQASTGPFQPTLMLFNTQNYFSFLFLFACCSNRNMLLYELQPKSLTTDFQEILFSRKPTQASQTTKSDQFLNI